MTLVAAMAIQNAAHRVHLPDAPPTTLMTGTTTQIMIDLADIFHGPADVTTVARSRLARMSASVAAFAVGCGAAAIFYALFGTWCFLGSAGARAICASNLCAQVRTEIIKSRCSCFGSAMTLLRPGQRLRLGFWVGFDRRRGR